MNETLNAHLIGQLVLLGSVQIWHVDTPGHLPEDQSQGVHVGLHVGVEGVGADGLVEHLGRHVALRADTLRVVRNVEVAGEGIQPYREAEVTDTALAVGFDENVARLEVTVGYLGFTLCWREKEK